MSAVIPEGWSETTLGKFSNIQSGVGFPKKYQGKMEGTYPVYKVGDVSKGVQNNKGILTKAEYYVSETEAIEMKGKVFEVGSTLFAKIGEAVKLNRRGFVKVAGLADNNVMSVKAHLSEMDQWTHYYLKTIDLATVSRSTTVPSVRKGDIEELRVNLPPLAEQKVIADKLDELLAQVESTKARLDGIPAILKSFRQSVLKAAVSGKLTEEWRGENFSQLASLEIESLNIEREKILGRIKKVDKQLKRQPNDVELPPLPSSWCYNHLDPFLSLERAGMKTGPFGSLLKKSEHKITGIPVLGIENISDGTFSPETKIKITEEKASELAGYDIQPGDLIISRSGTVGDICVIPDGMKIARFSTNIMRLSFMKGAMLPSFFTLLFLGSPVVLKQVADLCKGSTRLFLNQKILSSIKYPVPPKKEQTEIVRRVEALFAFAEIVEAQVNAAQARVNHLTQSILAKAFRGELTKEWRTANPELISGENSAKALLKRIKSERETLSTKSKPSKSRKKVTTNEG